jgi:hypothetical protein
MQTVTVYCPETGPRLTYAFATMFSVWLGVKVNLKFTSDESVYNSADSPKINYSNTTLTQGLHIPFSGFFGRSEYEFAPACGIGIPGKILFPVDGSFDFSYDLPAAVFWNLSRMEEYNNKAKDLHGRFSSSSSFAQKNNFLDIPVTDRWMQEFKAKWLAMYPSFQVIDKRFRFLSTIDVDNGYKFRGKNVYRQLGGAAKDLLSGQPQELLFRLNVFLGNLPDPFDRYEWISRINSNAGLRPLFFILASPRTRFDHALSPKSHRWKELVRKIAAAGEVGIHPSYYTSTGEADLKTEINAIKTVTGSDLEKSRQHFLRFSLPETLRMLADSGIKEEYSMGFADTPGFRAGTSEPYPFYDLKAEKELSLEIHPFCVMESIYRFKWKSAPGEAFQDMERICKEVKQVHGRFVSVWHDKSISRSGEGKRWAKIYARHLQWGNEVQ